MRDASISRRFGIFLLLTACALIATPVGRAEEGDYKRMPWHLVDLWWDLGQEAIPFQSYSLDVEISALPPSTTNLYVAPLGLGHLSETPFYGGIQTQVDGYTKAKRSLRKLGPGLLMSMWGERRYESIRPSAGGYCQSSGHEGDFVSVRRPYEWTAGRYTYRVVRMDEDLLEGQPGTWVGGFLHSHERDENIFIGSLRFPGRDLALSRKVASFVEIYGQRIPVEEIPQLTVIFSNPQVNGSPVSLQSVDAVYPQKVPDYAQTQWDEDRAVVTIGQPVPNRQERRVRLMTAGE